MAKLEKKSLLIDRQYALWDYLDALLLEIPEQDDVVEEVHTLPREHLVSMPVASKESDPPIAIPLSERVQPKPAEKRRPREEAVTAPVVLPEPPTTPAPVLNKAERVEVAVDGPKEHEAWEGGVPIWAKPEFQALLFSVGSLTLAVPLLKLHSVVPWSDRVTSMPNQPKWCHGLFRYREQNLRVVDTAALVIPEDKREGLVHDEPKHILVVGNGQWALSCTSIGEVIKLSPAEVKWRSSQGRRPWLAGTVLNHLCALVDVQGFETLMDQLGRNSLNKLG